MLPRTLPLLLLNFALSLTALAAPASSPITSPRAPAAAPITEITLERQSGLTAAPSYKLILRRNGTVTYQGISNVDRTGEYRGTLPSIDWDRLASLVQKLNFFALKARYESPDAVAPSPPSNNPRLRWESSSVPSVITSVVRGGTRKTIVNAADSGPMELWAIEKAILGVTAEIPWNPTTPPEGESGEEPTGAPGTVDGTSGVRGIALDGPINLGESSGGKDPRPIVNGLVIISSGQTGKEIKRVRTDSNGRFEAALAAGRYKVALRDPANPDSNRNVSAPRTVLVNKGQWRDMVMEYIPTPDEDAGSGSDAGSTPPDDAGTPGRTDDTAPVDPSATDPEL